MYGATYHFCYQISSLAGLATDKTGKAVPIVIKLDVQFAASPLNQEQYNKNHEEFLPKVALQMQQKIEYISKIDILDYLKMSGHKISDTVSPPPPKPVSEYNEEDISNDETTEG